MSLEFQEPGRVRLVAKYFYSKIKSSSASGPNTETGAKGKFAGIPFFEITSTPVEFEVVRDLDVVLTPKKPVKIGPETKVSELFDLRLVNISKELAVVSTPFTKSGVHAYLEIEYSPWSGRVIQPLGTHTLKGTALLSPGDGISLLGDGPFASQLEAELKAHPGGPVRVRAFYSSRAPNSDTYYDRPTGPTYYSKWVEWKGSGDNLGGQ